VPIDRRRTSKPALLLLFAYTRNVAFVTDGVTAVRSKRRYVRATGEPVTFNAVAFP
jgi:hypothetical protein